METRYFILFRAYYGYPQALEAVVTNTRSGWQLSSPYNALHALTEDYHETPDALVSAVLAQGFVEVDERAYEAAMHEPWALYAYAQYVTSESYLAELMHWSGYHGAPEVQSLDPASPEANAILEQGLRRAIRFDGTAMFQTDAVIFPQFNEVVDTVGIDKKLTPYWNAVACAGRSMPAVIDATELAAYAPFIAHIGSNEAGRQIRYFYPDDL